MWPQRYRQWQESSDLRISGVSSMNIRLCQAGLILILGVSASCSAKTIPETNSSEDSSITSICDVLRQPSLYSGKAVTITVRITSMKEATTLWSPACAQLGVSLHVDPESRSGSGIADLYKELYKYNLSSRPVIATLMGVYVTDYFDEIKQRKYPVFKVFSARDIKRSPKVELR
jgi:hypothetical protein